MNAEPSSHHQVVMKTFTVTIQQEVVVRTSSREDAEIIAIEHPPFRYGIDIWGSIKTVPRVEVVGIREER